MTDAEAQSTRALVVVATAPEPPGLRDARTRARRIVEAAVPLDQLKGNFDAFIDALQDIVGAGQRRVGEYALEEVSFNAEIGANGELKLLGSGIELSAGAGVTFTLRRRPEAPTSPSPTQAAARA
jgi:hypothetical protein